MKKFIINEKLTKNIFSNQDLKWINFIQNSQQQDEKVFDITQKILNNVKTHQDSALIELTNKFDKTNAKKINDLKVSIQEILDSEKILKSEIKNAFKSAFERIYSYHQKQLPQDLIYHDSLQIELGNIWKPISKIGVYIPGGTASYPSSVLMSAIPALVAGVKDITIFAPSNSGELNPAVLFCAKLCGIKNIYKIGGAQAIGAMAFGTKSIKSVDKIVGPGNAFVACAKKILYGEVGIDMIAGPTDITIIADESANPEWIAIDALSQLEHGRDSKAFIICNNEKLADKIINFVNLYHIKLSRHKIIEKSLKNSAIFVIKNIQDAHFISNKIAPEHLEICLKNPQKLLPKISNAGAIFIGNYSPEAIGDYIAGPSHTLPTSGTSRFASGLSVYDFLKRVSLISCTKESFEKLRKSTSILAKCEGLTAHQLSIDIRK
ncbi:MAG: histidinol dehydrogenase [Alphaproteobacteria bacterium]|nr:histidinol dehydrogenase [Alphaproteobacteria bacterium]